MTAEEFIKKIHSHIDQCALKPLGTITLVKKNHGYQQEDDWSHIILLPSAGSMQINDPKHFEFAEDEIGYIHAINPENWIGRIITPTSPTENLIECDIIERWDPCETSSIRTVSAIRNQIIQNSLSVLSEIISQQAPKEAAC